MGCIQLSSTRVGRIDLASERRGKILLSSSYVCDVTQFVPYLEIQPTTIWLADWGAINEVLSNTDWNIE